MNYFRKKMKAERYLIFFPVLVSCLMLFSGCDLQEELMDDMDIYFGNLHSHTQNSDGKGTPAEAFAWARNEAGYEFYAITDHSEQIMPWEWKDTGVQADSLNEDGAFVAMRGFEWSHAIMGHICVYNTGSYTNSILTFTLGLFYSWLDGKDGLAQFNHPGREIGIFRNLRFDEKVVDNMFAIETGNKGDGNNGGEYLSYYTRALDRGWHIAPTSNQDNHSLSTNCHRTAVIARELTRQGLLEAMTARRIYSTDDPDIHIVFKTGRTWMGSSISIKKGSLEFIVGVQDNEELEKIELVSNGGSIVAEYDAKGKTEVLWKPLIDVTASSYYFVKVTGINTLDDDSGKQIAVTAPIWVECSE